jgi:hypothetical protein
MTILEGRKFFTTQRWGNHVMESPITERIRGNHYLWIREALFRRNFLPADPLLLAAAPVDTLATAHRCSIHARPRSPFLPPKRSTPCRPETHASEPHKLRRSMAAGAALAAAHSRDAGVHPLSCACPTQPARGLRAALTGAGARSRIDLCASSQQRRWQAPSMGRGCGQGQRPGDSICGATRPAYRRGRWGMGWVVARGLGTAAAGWGARDTRPGHVPSVAPRRLG